MFIEVVDDGDRSVGLMPSTACKLEVSEDMRNCLAYNDDRENFARELKELVEKYYAPETKYYYWFDTESMKEIYGDMAEF